MLSARRPVNERRGEPSGTGESRAAAAGSPRVHKTNKTNKTNKTDRAIKKFIKRPKSSELRAR